MTQSIIVYRNPLEQQLWESGAMFPVMCGCAGGFVSFLIAYWLVDAALRKLGYQRLQWLPCDPNAFSTYIAGFLSMTAGLYTMIKMLG